MHCDQVVPLRSSSLAGCGVQGLETTVAQKDNEVRDLKDQLQQSQEQQHASELKYSQVRATDAHMAQQVSVCEACWAHHCIQSVETSLSHVATIPFVCLAGNPPLNSRLLAVVCRPFRSLTQVACAATAVTAATG